MLGQGQRLQAPNPWRSLRRLHLPRLNSHTTRSYPVRSRFLHVPVRAELVKGYLPRRPNRERSPSEVDVSKEESRRYRRTVRHVGR